MGTSSRPKTEFSRLLAAAREKRLVAFVGAGISVAPPTALPSWWDLSASVVRAIAQRASNVLTGAVELAELVIARQRADQFPPDYVAEKIAYSIRGEYFEVLRCIDSDRPNANHLALAELAATGKLRALVTTNFDRTIEAAFAARGIPLDVRADPESAGELATRWDEFVGGVLPCQLVKIHGTAERPDTIIDTLAQRAAGVPPSFLTCVSRLLQFGRWAFLGFSGADLETQPDYLCLTSGSADGRGFTWLVEKGKKPRDGVARLREAWGAKAEIVEGKLPDVLLLLLEGARPLSPSPAVSATTDVEAAARSWSLRLRERRCAMVIAELVNGAGETLRARAALEQIAGSYPQNGWKLRGGWNGDTLLLMANDDTGTPPDDAVGFGDREHPAVVMLAPKIEQDLEDRANYADVLYGLCEVLIRLGEKEAAAKIAMRSILAGFHTGRTRIVRGLGILAELRSDEDKADAREEADRLYAIAIEQAEPRALIRPNLLVNRGHNAVRLGRKREAFDMFVRAQQLFAERGYELGRAAVNLALGDLSAEAGDVPQAFSLWKEALEFARHVGDNQIRFAASFAMGRALAAGGERKEARSYLAEARATARSLRDRDREEMVNHAMASGKTRG